MRSPTKARKVTYVNGTAFTNEPVRKRWLRDLPKRRRPALGRLSSFLKQRSPKQTEAALKLARQYHVERGESKRHIIIAQTLRATTEITMLALSASAREHYREIFADHG